MLNTTSRLLSGSYSRRTICIWWCTGDQLYMILTEELLAWIDDIYGRKFHLGANSTLRWKVLSEPVQAHRELEMWFSTTAQPTISHSSIPTRGDVYHRLRGYCLQQQIPGQSQSPVIGEIRWKKKARAFFSTWNLTYRLGAVYRGSDRWSRYQRSWSSWWALA